MGRCMGDDVMRGEYPDRPQRYQVCMRQWETKKNLKDHMTVDRYDDDGNPVVILSPMDSEFTVTNAAEDRKGDVIIEGWWTTEKVNRQWQRVLASAFDWDGAVDRFNGRVLAFHDHMKEPVGVAEKYEVRTGDDMKRGIWGRIRVFKENPGLFMRAVRNGVLDNLSIGFGVLDWDFDEDTETIVFTKAYLGEVSIVNIGAAPEAVFEVVNSLQDAKTKDNDKPRTINVRRRDHTLDPELKKRLEEIDSASSVQDELIKKNFKELKGIYVEAKESHEKLADNVITKAEWTERIEKISVRFTELSDEIEKAKLAAAVTSKYVVYDDFRSLIDNFVWLTDDSGQQVRPVEQRAYRLFQMPVNYDKMDCGQELKNVRNLLDCVVLFDAYGRAKKGINHSITKSKLWTELLAAVKPFDEEVYNAMAGGNTGYGAEFIPLELSSEFNELLRITPTLANKFPLWQMPRGGSAYYPFQNGKAVAYKGSEATVNNPVEARKTDIATGRKLFTPDVFIGALVSSEELNEDSVIEMVSFIRQELSTAILEGLDSAIINGDSTSPHQDNAHVTFYQTYDLETCFKGLRRLAVDDVKTVDIETASSGTGVYALEMVNFTELKEMIGVAGIKPSDCIYITGVRGRGQVQQALWGEGAAGILAYMISGVIPTLDGTEVFISGEHNEQLESDGLGGTSLTASKHTSLLCVHKPSFRVATRRGVTVEFDKNILTQQQQFVATARYDFGKVCAATVYPVSCGINCQHTA